MKAESKVIVASVAFGILAGGIDAVLDAWFFYEGPFLELLIKDVPPHEIYVRSLLLLFFVVFGLVASRLIREQRQAKEGMEAALSFQQELINAVPVPIFYKDAEGRYLGCNRSFEKFMGLRLTDIEGKSVYDIAPPELAETYDRKDRELLDNPGVQTYDFEVRRKSGEQRTVVFHKATFHDASGEVGGLIGAILDVTEIRETESRNRELISELQEALENIKKLSGLIPICASCKKVRDDEGYWEQIESYIAKHSETTFSHGYCPECFQRALEEAEKFGKKEQGETGH